MSEEIKNFQDNFEFIASPQFEKLKISNLQKNLLEQKKLLEK